MTLHLEYVDFDVLRAKSAFPVGGVFYVTIGDTCFPKENWYDIVSVDLERWLPNLISFAQNHTDTCLLSFMDGPCCIKLERQVSGSIIAVCLWDRSQVVHTEIDFLVFLTSVEKCIRKYNRVLHENGSQAQFRKELSVLSIFLKQNNAHPTTRFTNA